MRHRNGGDAHVAAHHDDAGALVDDDLGREIRLDLQLLDLGEQGHDVALELRRNRELHRRGIDRFGGLGAEEVVDGGGDAFRGGEVGVAQREPHIGQAIEREFDLALDNGAVGDAADRGHALGDAGGRAFGREAADRQGALSHRIDVAVGAEQGGDQQGAALQALGIAERGDGDVDPGALGAERRKIAGDHHGGDVAGADGGAADVDAHAFQHRLQRLLGERNVVQRIAGAVEADDEAVTDQLILAHALDVREILDPRRRAGRSVQQQQRENRRTHCLETPSHPLLPAEVLRFMRHAPHDTDPPLTQRKPCQEAKPLIEKGIVRRCGVLERLGGRRTCRSRQFLPGPLRFINHKRRGFPDRPH